MTAVRQYELIYIVSPETSDEGVADLHNQVEGIVGQFGGQIEKSENWGRRRLAYEIKNYKEGTYVLELINGPGDLVKELGRRLRVSDHVIRHLIVRVDEDRQVADAIAAQRRETQARRRLARGLSPVPEARPRAGSDHDDEEAEGGGRAERYRDG